MNELPSDEKLLETEAGMFLMEMEKLGQEAEEFIGASTVSEELKGKCREVIKRLQKNAREQFNKPERMITDPYDLARYAASELYTFLDLKNDPEQETLFTGLRDVILKARSSAKGWQWPPKQV